MVSVFTSGAIERIVGIPHRAGVVFFFSGLLLTLAAGPLAFFLPFSQTALVLTCLLVAMLNVSALMTISAVGKKVYLQFVNITALGMAVALVMSSAGLRIEVRSLGIGLLLAGLALLVYYSAPPGIMKRCAPVQQVVLAAVLLSWLLIHEGKLTDSPQLASLQHFRMGLRAVFLGPLGMFAVVFISSIFGWSRFLVGLAGVCFGQYAIGLIELGVRLDSRWLMLTALISAGAFLVLVTIAIWPRKWTIKREGNHTYT